MNSLLIEIKHPYLIESTEQSSGATEIGCAQIAIIIIMHLAYNVTGYHLN